MGLRKNDELEVTFTGYGSAGEGVARAEGLVIFVKGALRGERARIRLMKVGKSAAWGLLLQVLEPSPERRSPDCPYYPRCGGCQLRHMSYEEELELKRQRVEDCLQRLGGWTGAVSGILGAKETMGYRNKVQFPAAPGPDGARVGFYRARSHDVIDIDRCLLQPAGADAVRRAVKEWMERFSVPAYREEMGEGLIRHVYVRTNRRGEALACVVANGDRLPREEALTELVRRACPELTGLVLGVNTRQTNVILGDRYRTLWGADTLEDTLCGLTFRLSVPSFYQVNADQAEVLYQQALDFAGLTGGEAVLDLYCGAGTISLVMARRAGRVYGAEIVPQAVENARENARRNGVDNAAFFCADAGQAALRLAEEGVRPRVICVDPPRKGLSADVIRAVAQMAPERVVYVSCDPATLGRDVKLLAGEGYGITRAAAVDLFPRTAHVETVTLLERG